MIALTPRLTTRVAAALAMLGLWVLSARAQVPAAAAPPPPPGAVLALLSTAYGQPGIDNYVRGLYAVLAESGLPYTRIHVEYLDLVKHGNDAHRERLAQAMEAKYGDEPIGVVVAVQPAALNFLLREGRSLAPQAPLLVSQARLPPGTEAGGRRMLFQTPQLAFAGTLQRALELFPRTRHVVVLGGSSEVERGRLQDARSQFAPWEGRLRFEYTDGWTLQEAERRLAEAAPDTVVIAPGINRDAAGVTHVPVETIVRIAATARAPVFPVYSVSIGRGPVGGVVSVLEDEGRAMARTALDALRAGPEGFDRVTMQIARPVSLFDWRQIERWGADPGRLPPDTVFLHRPPSLWEEHRTEVIAGSVVLALLLSLVLALSLQNRRRRRAELSLRDSERQYRLLADNISDVLWIFNLRHQRLEYVSPSVERLCGCSPEEARAAGLAGLLMPSSMETLSEAFRSRLPEFQAQPDAARIYTDTVEVLRRDGRVIWAELVTRFVRTEQGELALLGMSRDITQRRAAEQEVSQLAFYDTLTGLPNRRLLADRAQHALAASARTRRSGALLFIDLDNFKTLNDSRGHDVGDLLLRQVAQRLRLAVREGDTIARLGGDEFVLLLEGLDPLPARAAEEASTVAEKALAELRRPFLLDGHEHHATASIGVTLFAGRQDSVEELLKRADLAMYRAKSAGRNALRFFDPEMQAAVAERAALESALRRGLQAGELLLHYQPQVRADGSLVGAEALVRWQHPGRGLVPPGDFIPIAEETGLILPLGHWVLEAACAQLAAWSADPAMAGLTLSINVSSRQFRRPEFTGEVVAALHRSGVAPHRLKLELTESHLLDDIDDTCARIAPLRERGVGFSLDDFGTGYSSLTYLRRLPLDQIKIDRAFVHDLLSDPDAAAIARTVIELGRTLRLTVVAEGVETAAQREMLAAQGCDVFQGYLFGRPMPVADFDAFARSGTPMAVAED